MDTKPTLSDISLQRLSTCHPDLIRLVQAVCAIHQVSVMVGFRDEQDQNEAFATGHSTKKWPESKHNVSPSLAVDMTLSPYDPNNIARLQYFAGFVMGIASSLNIPVRWGGDWLGTLDPSKNRFPDMFHFELCDPGVCAPH